MLQLSHEVLGLLGFSCQLAAGSTICAFTCSGCQSCGHHLDANFDFSLSITAKWTPCSKKCDSCRQAKLRVYKTEMLRIPCPRLIFFIFGMMNKDNFQFRCNKEEKSVGYLQVEGPRFSAQRSWNHVFSPSFWKAKEMWISPILHWRKLHWRCLGPFVAAHFTIDPPFANCLAQPEQP